MVVETYMYNEISITYERLKSNINNLQNLKKLEELIFMKPLSEHN